MSITFSESYLGFPVYSGKKSQHGFYSEILAKIHSLLSFSLNYHASPRAVHFVIESPIDAQLSRLSEILSRWQKQRDQFTRRTTKAPLYLYAVETKPTVKTEHLHLMVILDGCDFNDVMHLRERLVAISKVRKCRLLSRAIECLKPRMDNETGEVWKNPDGSIARHGSRHYHKIRNELEDCFKRFSYLAKVFSKKCSSHWSSSRHLRLATEE